ncbi:DUF4468 domain-containing protein [Hymenobacter sp. CRA2]|uniref:DUF4468 domain-containing protein n=1 Tax=Hymenobacter sp. CRA2 TaxID=1955620 RepID=UPI0009CC4BAC|nr:DUF4468 domain-containing protein [Hymenobacter sp. CRA2]OON68852.1 hypothetical protein B0919_11810 [Hymenobacter sp. CRA2]
MRHLYCLAILSFTTLGTAYAQKPTASFEPRTYLVGSKALALYAYPEDTARASTITLPAGSKADVVGSKGKNWAVIERKVQGQKYYYYAPASSLLDFSPVLYQGQEKAATEAFPIDANTQHYTYQGVVEVPGVNKDELYTRAYEWMAKTYRSANAVIQMHDKEAGRLVGKGATIVPTERTLTMIAPGFVRHTLTLYIKDGRYKYVLTDFEYVPATLAAGNAQGKGGPLEQDNPAGVSGGEKRWTFIRQETRRDAFTLTSGLMDAMAPKKGQDASDF